MCDVEWCLSITITLLEELLLALTSFFAPGLYKELHRLHRVGLNPWVNGPTITA